jgi:hypothetical protein
MSRWKVSLLALALLAFAPAPALAQADITGGWDVTIDSPQGPATVEATLKQAGEEVTGVITSPLGSVELKGTMVQDTLTINYTVPLQGQNLDITMSGKLDGDTMKGSVVIVGLGEVPWTAKRKPAAAAAAGTTAPPATTAPPPPSTTTAAATTTADGISGKWDVLMDTPAGQIPFSASLTQAGEKVTGTIEGPGGDVPVAGTLTGNALKMEFAIPTPQGDLAVSMTGDLGPAGLTGKASTMMGDVTWSATRAKQ